MFKKTFQNMAYTENGALSNASTTNKVLDFFGAGGALRESDEDRIRSLFTEAYQENKLLALRAAFYIRDIRGGQGERRTFRVILRYLAENDPQVIVKILSLVPFYGRWDDLFVLIGTSIEPQLISLLTEQLKIDLRDEHPSLLAKWMPSVNTSSKKTRLLARELWHKLGYKNAMSYRKTIAELRKKIKIVEQQMCKNEWSKIKYDIVPSQASRRYIKAFKRHDEERYNAYIQSVLNGTKKIKTSTTYPYEIIRDVENDVYEEKKDALNALWNNLPNYVTPGESAIAVVDTSASMRGLPIQVAISLGIYFGERNKGAFENCYITFSSRPMFVSIGSGDIYNRYHTIRNNCIVENTNIQAVFDLILNRAKANKLPQSEMPTRIYIISDMEFDQADPHSYSTNFEVIKNKYTAFGYKIPQLVFWNVNSQNTQYPITTNDKGVVLVSGLSPSIFKHLMGKNEDYTSLQIMEEILNGERYQLITV